MSDQNEKEKNNLSENYISMLEASKLCLYSQEYLSLLARRGRIFAKKIGRNWYTTKEALNDYLSKQSIVVSIPRNIFQSGKLPILKSERFGKSILIAQSPISNIQEPEKKIEQQLEPPPSSQVSPLPQISPEPIQSSPPIVSDGKIDELVKELRQSSQEQRQFDYTVLQELNRLNREVSKPVIPPSAGLLHSRRRLIMIVIGVVVLLFLYVVQKTAYGFIVRELNGLSTGKFDWLAIARRKGFDTGLAPSPTPPSTDLGSPVSSPSTTLSENASSSAETIVSPTPTPTSSPVPIPIESPTPSPSESPVYTSTPSESSIPSPSSNESSVPSPSESPLPIPTP